MIKIGIVGDIGSGKSFVAKQFGYPVFDADKEVLKIYKKNKNCFFRLKKKLPKFITSFPIPAASKLGTTPKFLIGAVGSTFPVSEVNPSCK